MCVFVRVFVYVCVYVCVCVYKQNKLVFPVTVRVSVRVKQATVCVRGIYIDKCSVCLHIRNPTFRLSGSRSRYIWMYVCICTYACLYVRMYVHM